MSNSKWFPNARQARYALVSTTAAFMAAEDNRDRIGFAPATPNGIWYDTVCVPKLNGYFATFRTWDNPATSTRPAFDDLKDAENGFFPLYREFYRLVKASPAVTNAELEEMGFPPRPSGQRSSHPVDRLFIDLHAQPLGSRVLKVTFRNRDTGSSVIPYYLTGAVIYYVVSDTPVTVQTELLHSTLATRSPHRLAFEPSLRGKTVYLAARWQNRRGELGPWSEIISAIIP